MNEKPNSNGLFQHAFTNDALGKDDAVALAEKLRQREISPEALAKAAFDRANNINPKLSAITYLAKANQLFHKSPSKIPNNQNNERFFEGIPTFLKDNVNYKSMPTGFGTHAFPPKVHKKHSPYTQQFRGTGVCVIGKSSLPEFGFNASTEPAHTEATKNPWNINFSSGASSGGSATLVAAGVVPFAHGNDGGGSIRIPAACCGLVGLKPSRGRHINEYVARALPVNIVSEGIVSRSVRDTAYFHFEAQKVYQNPKLPTLPLVTNSGKKRLRIGVFTDSITGYSTDKPTRDACLNTADTLAKAGHQVEEMRFPVSAQFSDDFSMYWGMLAFMVKNTGKLSLSKEFDQSKKIFTANKQYVERDRAFEEKAKEELRELDFRFNAHSQKEELGWKVSPGKLDDIVKKLLKQQWDVTAQGKTSRSPTELKSSVSSNQDWFELATELKFEDQKISLPDILDAIRNGEKHVVLGDGSFGVLPEEWLNNYTVLTEIGEVDGEVIKLKKTQITLIDALLAKEENVDFDEEFQKQKKTLEKNLAVSTIDPPNTFLGSLRPYQIEGLSWMKSRQKMNYGLLLADDMGLGKTVQIIALLSDFYHHASEKNLGPSATSWRKSRDTERPRSRKVQKQYSSLTHRSTKIPCLQLAVRDTKI